MVGYEAEMFDCSVSSPSKLLECGVCLCVMRDPVQCGEAHCELYQLLIHSRI